MDKHTKNKIIAASQKNDIEEVKQWLRTLNILKEPGVFKKIHGNFLYLGKRVADNLLDNWDTPTLMTSLFMNAAANNNMDFCKYLVDSKELRMHVDLNKLEFWSDIISLQHFELIKYLIDSPQLKYRGRIIVNSLKYVRDNPSVEILKYLIEDQSMPHHKEIIEALNHFYPPNSEEEKTFDIFANSCASGNKEWVEFLLEKKMVNRPSFVKGLNGACIYGHLDIMKCLLQENLTPYQRDVDYFPLGLLSTAAYKESWDIIKFLIFDFNIRQPSNLNNFFNKEVDTNIAKEIESMFALREFKNNLETTLDVKPENSKKRKKI